VLLQFGYGILQFSVFRTPLIGATTLFLKNARAEVKW